MTTQTSPLPPPPPEALLITERRLAFDLSMRQGALKAGISPTAWTEAETARKKVAAGVEVYRRATKQILSKIAPVLEITPDDWRRCGREDAALHMERLIAASQALGERQKGLLSRLVRDPGDDGHDSRT